ncbi:MAG: hypothetical protein GC154_10795 [bacterium]|nr:hypothetical protein [bacterium]
MENFAQSFDLTKEQKSSTLEVIQLGVDTDGDRNVNVLWPGETGRFQFRISNTSDQAFNGPIRIDVYQYGTKGRLGDIWKPEVFIIKRLEPVETKVAIDAKASVDVEIAPLIPETFGGYALVFDFGERGRVFGASLVRVIKPDMGRVQYPTFALDLPREYEMRAETMRFFKRIGVKGARSEAGAFAFDDRFDNRYAEFTKYLKWMYENEITVMLTLGASSLPQPLARPRPHLNDQNEWLDTKSDYAWLPEYDETFQRWVAKVCRDYGWPKGPINAVELWNEPWEGISISGWGADMLRYRRIFTYMARGVEEARRDGAEVLIGGACSSSNTLDKLFCDGTGDFLQWLDFCSIHYQPLAAAPSLIKDWLNRESPYGPVRCWDTESWVANSEDRVGVVIASMRAQGQSRTVGIYGGNVYDPQVKKIDGKENSLVQAWAPAAAIAASQKFIGQREFREILFKNGLPWVFIFNGKNSPDDGSVVVVGDLGDVYSRDQLLFRSVQGLSDAGTDAHVLHDGKLTLPDGNGRFVLCDFYGNPLPSNNGRIEIPLNHLGYYLRTDQSKGSFDALISALRESQIEGYEPLDIIAHDFTRPIESNPELRLTLTNVLNRPVEGMLKATMQGVALSPPEQTIRFEPNQTREVVLKARAETPSPANAYPVSVTFDAGADGTAIQQETMRVNWIARRSITVDGELSDWQGAIPQPVSGEGVSAANLTEQAWLPFKQYDSQTKPGQAVGYLAYDDQYFYFAAKIADESHGVGMMRYETPDWDGFFYPQTSIRIEGEGNNAKREPMNWPDDVRRFSYRRDIDIPSGNHPAHDNVQIAFNVIEDSEEPWLTHPAGTMPKFMCYLDTDYEYALNPVADQYGGGVEIWRLLVSGMPRKHFYPRQPKSPYDGPVKDGRLAIRHEGSTRVVESALPWSEIPKVKERIDAGKTIKFSFRVNDDRGPALELAEGRGVSKINFPAFHADWRTHWANELEFGVER